MRPIRGSFCASDELIGLHDVRQRLDSLVPIRSLSLKAEWAGTVAVVTQVKVRNQWGIKGEGDV